MLTSPPDDPMSIFMNGKLKPGAYKVQNLASQTYLEILEHSRGLCCRPAGVLTPKDAVWDFQTSGSGYRIKKVDRGKPDQFCNAPGGLFFGFGSTVSATAFPAAWRIELVDDIQYRGFGYVRIFWESTNKALDLSWWGSNQDGTKVALWEQIASDPWRIWKLIPVQVEVPPAELSVKKNEAPPPYSTKATGGVNTTRRVVPRKNGFSLTSCFRARK